MITIGGVELNKSLYLDKRNSAAAVSVSTEVTVEGYSYTMAKPYLGGRQLELGTMSKGGRIMGIWCQEQIDQLKSFEQLAQAVTLDYHGETFNVLIESMDLDDPLHQNQVEGPGKLFVGKITLMEV